MIRATFAFNERRYVTYEFPAPEGIEISTDGTSDVTALYDHAEAEGDRVGEECDVPDDVCLDLIGVQFLTPEPGSLDSAVGYLLEDAS